MSEYPETLRYTREHEWVRLEADGTAVVGITHFAQEQLGDVVYLSLPRVGERVSLMGKMGEIESVKAVSDLYSPVTGEVVEVNQEVVEHPELVNEDPYGRGWLIKVRPDDPKEVETLMTAQQYRDFLASQA